MNILSLQECIVLYGSVFGPIRYNEQFASIDDVFLGEIDSY